MDVLITKHEDTDLSTAMIAGCAAGVVQAIFLYPLEDLKTSLQIENQTIQTKPLRFQNINSKLIRSPLVVGMALKSSSHVFILYQFSKLKERDTWKTSLSQFVVAGMITPLLKSFWVIPFENIKTRLIENALLLEGMRTTLDGEVNGKSFLNSKSNGTNLIKRTIFDIENNRRINALRYYHKYPSITFSKIVREIYQTQGLCGFKQGTWITILKECLSSVVWYGSFLSFEKLVNLKRDSNDGVKFAGIAFASSVAVVGITQPIDVLKTRMQTKDYRLVYKDFKTCASSIFFEEGFSKFWSGSLLRISNIYTSISVSYFIYELIIKDINSSSEIKPFVA